MAVCIRCGNDDSEIDAFIFCSKRKEFICRKCEHYCENYSAAMLPNGTHCRYAFGREDHLRRLLQRNILASPGEVQKARARYENMLVGTLAEEFRLLTAKYKVTVDEAKRNVMRVNIAAMQSILREQYARDSRQRFMFKTDEEIYGKESVG